MDGLRFDAWTRRRFGLVVGGLAGALSGGVHLAKAKDKDKKERCRKVEKKCGGNKKCCGSLKCGRDDDGSKYCCRKTGTAGCTPSFDNRCCTGACDPATQECFCKANGQPCQADRNCCSGNCSGSTCAAAI